MDGNTLRIWCGELADLTSEAVTGPTSLTVANKDLDKKETCGRQNTYLTTLTRWQRDAGATITLTATGSNNMTDLEG